MSDHLRQQILAGFETVLTGLTTTATRCYLSRVRLLPRDHDNALLLRAGPESIETLSLYRPSPQLRRFRVEIAIVVRATDALDAAINVILAEVEVALAAAGVLTTIPAQSLAVAEVGAPQQVQGEQQAALAVVGVDVTYTATEGDPTGATP
ncbi:MAG: hypothetical protein WC809_18855 [Sinimarinibacterium sp.]|jgi:hypothetical protein